MRTSCNQEKKGEIDLLGYAGKVPRELLVIEGKALLAPDEINEVSSAMAEMKRGQEQLERAIRIIRALPLTEKRDKFRFVDWDSVDQIYGIVVCSDASSGIGFEDHWPAVSVGFIKRRLRAGDYRSPRRVFQACLDLKWLRADDWRMSSKEIQVSDITYEIPLAVS